MPPLTLMQLALKLHTPQVVTLLRRAQDRYPADFWVNERLGVAMGKVAPPEREEVARSLTAAAALRPNGAGCLLSLGNAPNGNRQLDGAITCFRKAVEIDPKIASVHYNPGLALHGKGQVDETIACHGLAIEINPKLAENQNKLAGDERLATARGGFADFQNGRYKPISTGESLGLVGWCRIEKWHQPGAGLYADAIAGDPKLVDDVNSVHRYAACFAILAADGRGEDSSNLDDPERIRLRRQALDRLRADLILRARQLENGQPADRAVGLSKMKHWRRDTDLAPSATRARWPNFRPRNAGPLPVPGPTSRLCRNVPDYLRPSNSLRKLPRWME